MESTAKAKDSVDERFGGYGAASDASGSDIERRRLERARKKARGYEPTTDEERALDKSLNLRLDAIVVLVCAINFVLQGIDKGNLGNVATTKSEVVHTIHTSKLTINSLRERRSPQEGRYSGLRLNPIRHFRRLATLLCCPRTQDWS